MVVARTLDARRRVGARRWAERRFVGQVVAGADDRRARCRLTLIVILRLSGLRHDLGGSALVATAFAMPAAPAAPAPAPTAPAAILTVAAFARRALLAVLALLRSRSLSACDERLRAAFAVRHRRRHTGNLATRRGSLRGLLHARGLGPILAVASAAPPPPPPAASAALLAVTIFARPVVATAAIVAASVFAASAIVAPAMLPVLTAALVAAIVGSRHCRHAVIVARVIARHRVRDIGTHRRGTASRRQGGGVLARPRAVEPVGWGDQ